MHHGERIVVGTVGKRLDELGLFRGIAAGLADQSHQLLIGEHLMHPLGNQEEIVAILHIGEADLDRLHDILGIRGENPVVIDRFI